jgi:hypothetical protein
MSNEIPVDRQAVAAQVGQALNSIHAYLNTLLPLNAEGQRFMPKQMEQAHMRLDEASFWAIQSVIANGVAPAPTPAPEGSVATDEAAPLPTDNASGAEAV